MSEEHMSVRTIFRKHLPALSPAITISGLTALCLVWNWKYFSTINLGIFDTAKEVFLFTYLKHALQTYYTLPIGMIPVTPKLLWIPCIQQTMSYWGNPEVFTLSPLLPFLYVMPVPVFIKFYMFTMSVLGTTGSYYLGRRRLGFSPGASLLLVVFFACNPWIIQHLAAGYTPNVNLLLYPWIVYHLLNPKMTTRNHVYASLLTALILYQGSLHVFVWMILSMVIVFFVYVAASSIRFTCIYYAKFRRTTATPNNTRKPFHTIAGKYLVESGIVLWFRFIPYATLTAICIMPKVYAILTNFNTFRRTPRNSYSSFRDLFGLFTDTTTCPYQLPQAYNIYGTDLYDASNYMGIWFLMLGAAAVILLCVRAIRKRIIRPSGNAIGMLAPVCLFSAIILAFLGWNQVWVFITKRIHILDCEHYPSRFLYLATILLVVFVLHEWNRFFSTFKGRVIFPSLCICALFIPTLLGTYARHHYFSRHAVSHNFVNDIDDFNNFFNRRHEYISFYSHGEPVPPPSDCAVTYSHTIFRATFSLAGFDTAAYPVPDIMCIQGMPHFRLRNVQIKYGNRSSRTCPEGENLCFDIPTAPLPAQSLRAKKNEDTIQIELRIKDNYIYSFIALSIIAYIALIFFRPGISGFLRNKKWEKGSLNSKI
jgi:hypothetical protein